MFKVGKYFETKLWGSRKWSKIVGDKCGKIDVVNDGVKSEAEKEEENDNSIDQTKLDGEDVA